MSNSAKYIKYHKLNKNIIYCFSLFAIERIQKIVKENIFYSQVPLQATHIWYGMSNSELMVYVHDLAFILFDTVRLRFLQ